MKQKLFSILALLIVLSMSAWAAGETFEIKFKNKNSIVESPTGYFTYDKGEGNAVSWSANGKHSCTYGGENYDNVIKMEGATQCYFTTTVEATVTIVQTTSNATGYKLKFDGTIIDGNMSNTTVTENGDNTYNEYVITNVAAGKHTITRTSETGLAYVKVEYATTYSVTLAEGTEDADKWTITPKEGLSEGDQVTIQYNGRLKVKGVKATSDAAAASVPDGAISGVFSVSATKKVYFSKGNLRYASGAWSFFDNQYDYYASYSEDAWDKFGWSTSATTYGMNTSDQNSTYSGDFVDWGATMGTGWFTLSSDELTYLFNTRSASTVNNTADGRYAKAKVNDVQGVILFPDTYTHPDGVTAPVGVNATGDTGWNGNNYSSADWTKMESAGCVFLPAAGYRYGSSVYNAGTHGYFWPATPNGTDYAYRMRFYSGGLYPAGSYASRFSGYSVRLVREVTE